MIETAIISDIHGNLEALRAVLSDISDRGIRIIYCLGDIVGYGPNPNECCDLVQKSCLNSVAGNHDWAACGKISCEEMNPYAAAAINWTSKALSSESIKFLDKLRIRIDIDNTTYCHGSPSMPEEFDYIETQWKANANFNYFKQICFIGHTHKPKAYELKLNCKDNDNEHLAPIEAPYNIEIKNDSKYIANVGSTGQPRDGNPQACYTIASDKRLFNVRVDYPVKITQGKMENENLPQILIDRLSVGR